MTTRIQIDFDPMDIEDNYRFANSILVELLREGLAVPASDRNQNPLRLVANHIRYVLGFNGCHVVQTPKWGYGSLIFFKSEYYAAPGTL